MRRSRDAKDRHAREAAQAIADQLTPTIRVEARAGEGGRLFGSVTSSDIADAVKAQLGVEVDRRDITLDEPLEGARRRRGADSAPRRRHGNAARRGLLELAASARLSGPTRCGSDIHTFVHSPRLSPGGGRPCGQRCAQASDRGRSLSQGQVHDPQRCGRRTDFSTGKSHGCSPIDPQGERATFTSRRTSLR